MDQILYLFIFNFYDFFMKYFDYILPPPQLFLKPFLLSLSYKTTNQSSNKQNTSGGGKQNINHSIKIFPQYK